MTVEWKAFFKLRDIESLRPDEITEFVRAVAESESWALAAVEAAAGDGPFDRLASYWAASSQLTRNAIAEGVVSHLEMISLDDGIDADNGHVFSICEVLGFSITILPDLASDLGRRFLPSLVSWLCSGSERQQRLAAAAVASIPALDALRELEEAAQFHSFASWIIPSLLERRSRTEPFSLFVGISEWLETALIDPLSSAVLQDGIERMIEADAQQALRQIQDLRSTLAPPERDQIDALINELGISDWEALRKTPPARAGAQPTDGLSASGFIETLEIIERQCADNKSEEDIVSSWNRVLSDIPDNQDLMALKWNYIRDFSKEVAARSKDDAFFVGLRSALFGTPTLRRVSPWIKEIQRDFYDRKSNRWHDTEATLPIIIDRLKERMRPRSIVAKTVPHVIRIPTVIYAEEAYMETLRLLLRANFGNSLHIIEVPDISWDRLDSALVGDECDIGLNNDDILSHVGSPKEGVHRLSGPPLYKADDFVLLAQSEFLKSSGEMAQSLKRHLFPGRCLLDGADLKTLQSILVSLLHEGSVSVPKATLLETKLKDLIRGANGPVKRIVGETSDIGLIDFFSGSMAMYFGGSLQTSYAQRAWQGTAVPLCRLSMPVEGRLFARAGFVEQYPEFMADLAELSIDLPHAFESVADPAYNDALQYRLVHRLNDALFASSKHNITAVQNYDQLADALRQSELAPGDRGSRTWEPWTSEKDHSRETHVGVAEERYHEI